MNSALNARLFSVCSPQVCESALLEKASRVLASFRGQAHPASLLLETILGQAFGPGAHMAFPCSGYIPAHFAAEPSKRA